MKFSEIVRRLTGISTPVFGVSWEAPESDMTVAKRVIAQLEDRRVLFNPCSLEVPEHCVHSVIEIRRMLTEELKHLDETSSLSDQLRAMRAACRKFLDTVQVDKRIIRSGFDQGHFASWTFLSAIGELRGVFGVHLAQMAAQYGLDIEDDLASILPGDAALDDKST